jgi:hypothetical protein
MADRFVPLTPRIGAKALSRSRSTRARALMHRTSLYGVERIKGVERAG